MLPHLEEICALEIRDGSELAEYKDVEHTTALLWFGNTERFSDFGGRVLELVVPKQIRDMAFYGLMLFRDLVNLLQDVGLASTLHFPPENFGHRAIFRNLWMVLGEFFASDRKYTGGASLGSVVRPLSP